MLVTIDLHKLTILLSRYGKSLSDLGIPQTTIRRVLQGKAIRTKTAYRFAKALGVDVTEILKEGNEA